MWFFIFLICFTPNFLMIRSEDQNLVIMLDLGENCTLRPSYTFIEGRNVTFGVEWSGGNKMKKRINHGWWILEGSEMYANFTQSHIMVTEKSMEGVWIFKFYYLQDVKDFHKSCVTYDGHNYTQSVCSTNVTIETPDIKNAKYYIIIFGVVIGIALITIIAQAAYIVFLKTQAIKLNRHNNLSTNYHKEPPENDTTRYCSDPGKMMVKAQPSNDINRESIIYEAPNIELPDRVPIIQPEPPHPPAITTIPRTPRSNQHARIPPQTMPAAALNSPTQTDNEQCTFPRPKATDREINVAKRPPLPLPNPPHEMQYEVYEEMETDDNSYKPPPITNTLPPRHNIPQKKAIVPLKPVDVQREQQKMRSMNKPAVTRKPQRAPSSAVQSKTNELEEAFKRRNNVLHAPITSIPDTSRPGTTPPKLKPPPFMKSIPRAPPTLSTPVPKEAYYPYSNDKQDSSDEEWTYEPLKPLNSYNDNMNLYNI